MRQWAVFCAVVAPAVALANSFVNWETPHVHPLELTPNRTRVLAVNTADNRLEVFRVLKQKAISRSPGQEPPPQSSLIAPIGSVSVGLDPVSVRAIDNRHAWVVNHISDSVSIVDLDSMNVERTLQVGDEPADVVFAGSPQKAFVSCAQASEIYVFDTANLDTPPVILKVDAEEPRAMAVNADGTKVYVAAFESGNRTTVIGTAGGAASPEKNPVVNVNGPYAGQDPPPNNGFGYSPQINPALPAVPPGNALIVRQNAAGQWMDSNNADWSLYIDGGGEGARRNIGWTLFDNDVVVIDANTNAVSYLTSMMNIVMALDVQPTTGLITTVGTDSTNEVRFEPNLKGRFTRVNLAFGDESNPDSPTIEDLNPHLDYSDAQVATQANSETASQALRDQSIGDPRAIVWNPTGTRAYIAGMGSNNLLIVDQDGNRVGDPIELPEGPTGLQLDSARNRLYVLSKFQAGITIIDTTTNRVVSSVPMFDPTPDAIKIGRKHLYDTHKTSGLGQVSCASCHVDSKWDRLGWDLGDPTGEMKTLDEQGCNFGIPTVCRDWHPMKGVMTTQVLQDIIGKEPLHWRGDKDGLEEFNAAFTGLQGDDVMLTDVEMQEFEDMLASIHFPPNPFRNFDNSLPTTLDLTGHYSAGEFADRGGLEEGDPMPPGNPQLGMEGFRYEPAHAAAGVSNRPCISCHTFPTGVGTNHTFVGDVDLYPAAGSGVFVPNGTGPKGEEYTAITTLGLGTNVKRSLKVPQLRNMYKKFGFERFSDTSRAGFGIFNTGGETVVSFMHDFNLYPRTDQEVADVTAFLMCFSGSDLPEPDEGNLLHPPGPASKDAHAAVGKQVTFFGANNNDPALTARLAEMTAIADAGKIGLIAKGRVGGVSRGYKYVGAGSMDADKTGETVTVESLRLAAASNAEITFTVVPLGSETRIGVDRDEDGVLDGDE